MSKKATAVLLLAVITIVAFMTFRVPLASAQVSQGSPAWEAGYWFLYKGGMNELYFGVINVGTKPVVICYNAVYGGNGTVVYHTCTSSPIPQGMMTGWTLYERLAGNYGTLIVYSQDSSTPLAMSFGAILTDQQGNNVINAAIPLTWSATSPPSS